MTVADLLPSNEQSGRTLGAYSLSAVDQDVKLVIWDLDDTFWQGTLAEGPIQFDHANASIVRTLAARGILSSIASKNDHEAARTILERENIRDFFIFPSIAFEPKGQRVLRIIEEAALRPENVLFIDDNVSNLEEVKFRERHIMVAHASAVPTLLDHPRLQGKSDPSLKRLRQYQLLERKAADRRLAGSSNEDFLRASAIQISFDFDIEGRFDRLVELINRTNQLNYTKKRLDDADAVEQFKVSLAAYGVASATVSCRDRYGDYGVIGFFMVRKNRKENTLVHFLFSCRTMHMGIEQFVYEHLGRPLLEVTGDVAYPVIQYDRIDWISLSSDHSRPETILAEGKKLTLIGGCELLQLSSFCTSNRIEFVNGTCIRESDEFVIRFDDPFFLLANRSVLSQFTPPPLFVSWRLEDALSLDEHLASSAIVIISMREALNHTYVRSRTADLTVRIPGRNWKLYRNEKHRSWFDAAFDVTPFSVSERLDLIAKALLAAGDRSGSDARIFLLGSNTRREPSFRELSLSKLYNEFCRRFCAEHSGRFRFVDLDAIVPEASLLDSRHFTRDGSYQLSQHIIGTVE